MSRSQELWGELRGLLHAPDRDWVEIAGALAKLCACEGVSTGAVDYMLDSLDDASDLEAWLGTQMRLLARGTVLARRQSSERAFDDMHASYTLERARRDLHDMMSLWLGDRASTDITRVHGFYPSASLEGEDRAEARRLYELVILERAFKAQVNLGNYFPREVHMAYALGDHVDVSYEYVGPFSRGTFPNIHFELDGVAVYTQVMEDLETIHLDPLDVLRRRLQTPWSREKLLEFLWLVAESQRCHLSGGAQEVGMLRDQLVHAGVAWGEGLAGL